MGKVVVGNNGVEIQLTIDYKTITIIIIMEVIHWAEIEICNNHVKAQQQYIAILSTAITIIMMMINIIKVNQEEN